MTILIGFCGFISVLCLYFIYRIYRTITANDQPDILAAVRQEMSLSRQESSTAAKLLREEINQTQEKSHQMLREALGYLVKVLKEQREEVSNSLAKISDTNRKEAASLREEISKAQKLSNDSLAANIGRMGEIQKNQLEELAKSLKELITEYRKESSILREKIEAQFKEILKSNEQKLDEMRKTVDEKLHSTLEKRLGESFKVVSERLEAVHRGLGEMQNLATGVGDLKRVLTNVKTRGTWGEIQLGAILEQILTPQQYCANVQIKENSRERVEFAVKLPGRDSQSDDFIWLPIDAKFPKEDYERLVDASAAGDTEAVKAALDSLVKSVEKCAKDISDKYIYPPATTDFAIMFLPTEGLYAEILRQPGLHDIMQQKFRVVLAGPTTLSALLNSLRMGFHTLAIEKRSSEVWKILGAVKTEFGKFGGILDKVKGQLATASKTLDETSVRTRAMERKLNPVEALNASDAKDILQLENLHEDSDEE